MARSQIGKPCERTREEDKNGWLGDHVVPHVRFGRGATVPLDTISKDGLALPLNHLEQKGK